MTRERVRTWLATLGAIALFLAVMPSFEYRGGDVITAAEVEYLRANPNDLPFTEDWRLGWHSSPLVHYHRERTLKLAGDGVSVGSGLRTEVNWVSWSFLTLTAGVGLLWVARRMKPVPAPPPETVS
jgi:hypothetical protein